MEYIMGIVIGYGIGTFNLAYLIAKQKGIDIKSKGTKNAGASNATIVMGWKAGAMVAISDVLKAVLSIMLVKMLFPANLEVMYLSGIATIAGHIFPFYLNFNGGKGYASYLGMILALDWRIFLAVLLFGILITLVTDYITVATLATVTFFPAYGYVQGMSGWVVALYAALSVIIVTKHRDNLIRILNGTEVGLRKVNQGMDE